ncbi:uncharacterized protein LOC117893525 [Drosophila subobscura]|uniref:uncharacterized protein LOC117893525 n=1 Tax=Drosophila subobscura TaxID=7241 RepID=UPI00155A3681|nr:uncharacterized protein LOC117893525 [Drosophila subobscura]
MKKFSHPITINPNAKHFPDSLANVLFSMEKLEGIALAWPTCKGNSRRKQDLRSKQDCSFPEVPLAKTPSSLYPFPQRRPGGWYENSSLAHSKNTFYQLLQENQDPDSVRKVPPMPVYYPMGNRVDIRNMNYTRRLPNDGKVYANNNPYLAVNHIHKIERLPKPPSSSVASNVPTISNSQDFVLSSSSQMFEPKPNSIRKLTQHKKSTGKPKRKRGKQSKRSNASNLLKEQAKQWDTVSLARSKKSQKSETASIAPSMLEEIVIAEKQSLHPIRSGLIVKPYEQRLEDSQNDQGEHRRSILRENRSRVEIHNRGEETPTPSYEEQLTQLKEILQADTFLQNSNHDIDIENIVPTDVLHYPYPMFDEDTPKVESLVQTKSEIHSKQKLGARKTGEPLEKIVPPKKTDCCICQRLHRRQTKDAPFMAEMMREQKRQELLAYRNKMLAANPSHSGSTWCKTLDNNDQIVHQLVS